MNELTSNINEKTKKSDTIELGINDALIVCNIKDDFENFSKVLYDVLSNKNGQYSAKKLAIIDDLSCGRIVLGQRNIKAYYEKNKDVIDYIKEFGGFYYFFAINSDVNGNLYGDNELSKFYDYIKDVDDVNKIIALLNRLKELGFTKFNFNKNYDFTNREYIINKNYDFFDLMYVDNIEIVPSYDKNAVSYKTSSSNYLFKKSSYSYNNNIYLNDLSFDPSRLPNDISRKLLKNHIIELGENVKIRSNMIRNSVDFEVGIEELTDQFANLNKLVSKIDDINDKKELEKALKNIKDNLQIIKGISNKYNIETSLKTDVSSDKLVSKKNKYLERKMSYIDID